MAVSLVAMAERSATAAAGSVSSYMFSAIYEKLNDVIELDGNFQILDTDFSIMEALLSNIRNQFQDQQKRLPEPLEKCLKKMDIPLTEAKDLIDRAKRHRERGWCLRWWCCLLRNPNLPTHIRAWKATYVDVLQELERVFSIYADTQQIVSSTAPQEDLHLQPVPESGFIGLGIRAAQDKLKTWLNDPHCQARVIGVYGMAGVGKTSLLKVIYNTYKEVSGMFDVVVWFAVSQNFQTKELQASIAKELKLNLEETSSIEERKMRLYASLQNKKFLIVLDDVWSPIDLMNEVGVRFGDDNPSKIIISTRSKDVIGRMGALEYSMRIHPLSREEGWDLFRRGAFTNGVVPESNIDEAIAREIASECQGLPLAVIAVSAAMRWKKTNEEWRRALNMMRNADPSFPTTHRTIDAELYQPLKWSYNDLSDPNLQICFLYCAAFPEDADIPVEDLVEMWDAEGLITQSETTYYMDIGREYIDVLVSRCLVEGIDSLGIKYRFLRVHDVLRDMAIHIAQREAHWLLEAGQHLQNFPSGEKIKNCQRISLFRNDVHDLPMDFRCPKLVSLVLAENRNLMKVPEGFLLNLTSLRVLDLSETSISSLPASAGQLRQLEFLNLFRCTSLEDLHESICDLSHLQFLNLGRCSSLHSLPSRIGELKNMKHLNLLFCYSLMTIPHGIFQLTSLNELILPYQFSCTVNAEDLTNLSNLRKLRVVIKPQIKVGIMGPWLDMRDLSLTYNHGADPKRGDVDEDVLCESIKYMKNLESLYLANYVGANLPKSICQLRNLRSLCLTACDQLKEFPTLEIGSEATYGSFPMLQNMELRNLPKLESIISSSAVGNEGTMSKLESVHIEGCLFRDKLLLQVKKLPNLTNVLAY